MGPQIALGVAALGFAAMGLGSLFRPEQVLAQFGVSRLDIDGRNEVRGVYGGFGLAIAAILGVAAIDDAMRGGIALTVAVALVGMALGRVISAAIDKGITRIPIVYLVIELVGATALLHAAFG